LEEKARRIRAFTVAEEVVAEVEAEEAEEDDITNTALPIDSKQFLYFSVCIS
jgi:hypothetical protein